MEKDTGDLMPGGSGAVVHQVLDGEMTVASALPIKASLVEALQRGAGLSLGLRQVMAIDTAGIQLLLLLKRESERAGKSFRIEQASGPVRELIGLYGLTGVLGVEIGPEPAQ